MITKGKITECVLVVSIWLFGLVVLCSASRSSFFVFLYRLPELFYFPHVNTFRPPRLEGFDLFTISYISIILCSAIIWVKGRVFDTEEKSPFFKIILFTTVVMICLHAFVQNLGSLRYMKFWEATLAGLTQQDKYRKLYTENYDFAMACRQALPGRHKAALITDMDITSDPGMLHHRILAYFLYPIDIRDILPGETDCLVIFKKPDAVNEVPPGFEIVKIYDKTSLIAFKRLEK